MSESFETLYRRVEDVCLHKLGAGLYARLRASCESHVRERVATLRGRDGAEDPVAFLNRVDDVWGDHCDATLTIRSVFLYLDRTHVAHQAGGEGVSGANTSAVGTSSRPEGALVADRSSSSSSFSVESVRSLWDMGLALFRASLADDTARRGTDGAAPHGDDVLGKATRGLLALVERERGGEAVDRGKVKRLTRAYRALEVYSDRFEKQFLDATRAFYRAEGRRSRETATWASTWRTARRDSTRSGGATTTSSPVLAGRSSRASRRSWWIATSDGSWTTGSTP